MSNNTKARHLEILETAHQILEVKKIQVDVVIDSDLLRDLAKELAQLTDCHYDTAKRNIAKAVRQKRHDIENPTPNWGGDRGGGRPPKETE